MKKENIRDNGNKSYPKNKRKGFYFNQKSVFLTYPHTDKANLTKDELGTYLLNTFKPSVILVCQEHHSDESLHLHVWLEFEKDFFTRDCRIFDYKNRHAHFGKMKDKKKNTRANVIDYMEKEDKDLFVRGLDIDKWKYSRKHKLKYISTDLINGKSLTDITKSCPEILINYNKFKQNLNSFRLDTVESKNIFKTNSNLWLYGPPGSGKTLYVVKNYPSLYKKCQNRWWDGYNQEETVLIDDLDTKNTEFSHYLKIWADNYGCKGEIKNGYIPLNFKRIIITSNYLPEDLWPKDQQLILAIRRRFNFFTITGSIDNLTLIPFKKQITNIHTQNLSVSNDDNTETDTSKNILGAPVGQTQESSDEIWKEFFL